MLRFARSATLPALAAAVLSACGDAAAPAAKAGRGPEESVVSASGTLHAAATVPVLAQVAGPIAEVNADFGAPVKAGQVIARIDPAAIEQRIAQARADLAAARGAAAAPREAVLKQALADLERAVIRAPIDGTIVLRNVEAGQTVLTGAQAPALFAIAADLSEMRLEAAVSEAEAARLRAGQRADFTIESLPRRTFSGAVLQVRKPQPGAQGATVVIAAANPDRALLPGMLAQVRVATGSPERAAR